MGLGLEIKFWEPSIKRWYLKPRDDGILEEMTVDGKEKSKTWVVKQSSVYDWEDELKQADKIEGPVSGTGGEWEECGVMPDLEAK